MIRRLTAILVAVPLALHAQGDYVNTDRGRPLRIEDATPLERYALDVQLTPLRFERLAGGRQTWGVEPSLAYGIGTLTHVEVGLPLVADDDRAKARLAGGGVAVTLFHALSIERESWPAIALAASALLPAGGAGPTQTLGSIGARVTRSFAGPFRVHLNYDAALVVPRLADRGFADRWSAGIGVDHPMPLRALVLGLETYAAQPFGGGAVAWTTAGGARLQLAPRWTLALGAGRQWSGLAPQTFVTAGASFAFATRALVRFGASSPRLPVDQTYLPAAHNWLFRALYPGAERLFNAFDYGHAVLYEKLWTAGPDAPSVLETGAFAFLTDTLLSAPPSLAMPEQALAPRYSQLAPEAKAMFDWAHVLHRQVYDILSDERLTAPERDAAIADALRYYKSRRDLAFSSRPKSMTLMDGQPYSGAFRKAFPKFNGLIWSYHWLQMGLYEPLLTGLTVAEKQAGVAAAVARFRAMLVDPPATFPSMMPMTPVVAPTFAATYPELAIIFDNLHAMHDVISDILANPSVPRDRKRAEIVRAGAAYRDDITEVTTEADWRAMAQMMGADAQGGRVPSAHGTAAGTAAGPAGAAAPPAMSADEHAMHHAAPLSDSAFAALQQRGKGVMGVDQYASQHVFADLPDGGRISLTSNPADTAGTRTIRAHFRTLAAAFARGEFDLPGAVHAKEVPGTRVMAERRAAITYEMEELPGGGALRIRTSDVVAIAAIRAFMDFQRVEHRAPGVPRT